MRRCPSSFTQCIFVSTRLRRWYPLHHRQRARPRYFDARSASFRVVAPAVTVFHGLAFLRGGMTAWAPRSAIASWHFRVVVGTVGSDAADLLARRDLVEQVVYRPIEADQPQQAFEEACRLPKRHAKQHLHREACLDGGIAVGRLAATPAYRRGTPAHLRVKPDRQRAVALERFIVGWPVPSPVDRGGGLLMHPNYHAGFKQ